MMFRKNHTEAETRKKSKASDTFYEWPSAYFEKAKDNENKPRNVRAPR